MSECPNIVKTIPESPYNRKLTYSTPDGDYTYWHHTAPDGETSTVQFCRRIGRKRDVFQCLDEEEWRDCYAYNPTENG